MHSVILSRSEGSPGREETEADEEQDARLPPDALLPFTPGDPSLRLRMTGGTFRFQIKRHIP